MNLLDEERRPTGDERKISMLEKIMQPSSSNGQNSNRLFKSSGKIFNTRESKNSIVRIIHNDLYRMSERKSINRHENEYMFLFNI